MKTSSAARPLSQDIVSALIYWLRGRRGLLLAGAVIITASLALGWPSLAAAGVVPLLLSLAPCLIMCGLGFCMMKSCDKRPAANQAEPGANPVHHTSVNADAGLSSS